MRPQSIKANIQHVEDLAVFGGTQCAPELAAYLAGIGIANASDTDDPWCHPTFDAMLHLFPSASDNELARRLAIRDPLYRYHLDLALCSTVHAIGSSERWQRFEQIIFGDLLSIAPRILQVIAAVSGRAGVTAIELKSDHWGQASQLAYGPFSSVFQCWDRELWGECRGATDLFPLLLDLYLPICESAVFVCAEPDEQGVLDELVGAASVGEGLRLASSQVAITRGLQQRGLPIEIEETLDGTFSHLVAGVALRSDGLSETDSVSVPKGIPKLATNSRFCLGHEANCIEPLSPSELSHRKRRVAVLSIAANADSWITGDDRPSSTPWAALPHKADLETVGNWVAGSESSDEALRQLAVHPLYGFLFQVLLIEALDRELGSESLVFALRPNQKLSDVSAWADTQVLFRSSQQENSNTLVKLGTVDEVLSLVAKQVGIEAVVTPYAIENGGAWSTAFSLMNSAALVDGTADGWILTLNPLVFDRLHRGSLMKDVIRGGREFRNDLLEVFTSLAADTRQRPEAVSA